MNSKLVCCIFSMVLISQSTLAGQTKEWILENKDKPGHSVDLRGHQVNFRLDLFSRLQEEAENAKAEKGKISELEEQLSIGEAKQNGLNEKIESAQQNANEAYQEAYGYNSEKIIRMKRINFELELAVAKNSSRIATPAPFRGCPRGNSYEHCNHTGAKSRYDAYRRNIENQNEIAQKEIDQLEKSRKENRSQLTKAINRNNKAIDRFESINADINKLNRDWESREKRLNKLRQRIQDGNRRLAEKVSKINAAKNKLQEYRTIRRSTSDGPIEVDPVRDRPIHESDKTEDDQAVYEPGSQWPSKKMAMAPVVEIGRRLIWESVKSTPATGAAEKAWEKNNNARRENKRMLGKHRPEALDPPKGSRLWDLEKSSKEEKR